MIGSIESIQAFSSIIPSGGLYLALHVSDASRILPSGGHIVKFDNQRA